MSNKGFLIVRAEVAAASDRPLFDDWYRTEHMPEAAAAFKVERAWRFWSRLDPSVHYALYEFGEADLALAALHSDTNKLLGSKFDAAWGGRVTRTRDILETVDSWPRPI